MKRSYFLSSSKLLNSHSYLRCFHSFFKLNSQQKLEVISDFLLSEKEQNLEFLTRDNPEVTAIDNHADIHFSLINYLKVMFN